MARKKEYTLDLRGVIAPFTFLKVTQALREMKSGEKLEIFATDPDTRKYLFQILDATGHHRIIEIDDHNDLCRFLLEKREIDPLKPINFKSFNHSSKGDNHERR